jgi:fatty acid desaturase
MSQRTEVDFQSLERDLGELRARIAAKVGEEDKQHVRSVRFAATCLEVSGRVLIHVSLEPVSFGLGVLSLGLYKILENMELGHNVLHGQYDFMRDPTLASATYEWDFVGTARAWKRAHNATHHTFTNVLGKDDDFGYGVFRFSAEVPWRPVHLLQPLISPLSALFFDHAVAVYDLRPSLYEKPLGGEPAIRAAQKARLADLVALGKKAAKLYFTEYVFYPALAGPFAPKVIAGNALANGLRNVWAYAVIYCGHLTDDTTTFTAEELATETRGGFYLRQILGSSNFRAGPILGILSGHLSHQIEHHLFPDIPAWRYRELAPEVERICEKHAIAYNTGTFAAQLKSVARALVRHAFPSKPRAARRGVARLATEPVRKRARRRGRSTALSS